MGESTGFFGGVAEGFQGGARVGLAMRAQNLAEQQAQEEAQAKAALLQKQQFEMGKDRLGSALAVFKELPPASQQAAYNATIKPAAAAMGFDLSAVPLDDQLKQTLENVAKLTKLNRDGKLSDTDFEKALHTEAAAHVGGNKDIFGEVDKLANDVHQRVEATKKGTSDKALAGDTPIGEFVTHEVLKKAGFDERKIADGQQKGLIPKNLTQRQAQLLLPKGMTFNFGNGTQASTGTTSDQGSAGDGFASKLGF